MAASHSTSGAVFQLVFACLGFSKANKSQCAFLSCSPSMAKPAPLHQGGGQAKSFFGTPWLCSYPKNKHSLSQNFPPTIEWHWQLKFNVLNCAVAAAVVSVANCSSYVFCNEFFSSCVRSSMRFLKLWWQIALEWLLDCRHLMLPRA